MDHGAHYLHLIQDRANDGAFNMAADELLFRRRIETQDPNPILRFYRFSEPTLTVGYGAWRAVRNQIHFELPLIRRLTGGGIVRHDCDLLYTFISPIGCHRLLVHAKDAYAFLHEVLRIALLTFGISTEWFRPRGERQRSVYCFDAPVEFDLMRGPKKIAGAGEKRSQGYLLHQGSIAWDELVRCTPNLPEALFRKRFSKCLAEVLHINVKETDGNARASS